MRQYARSVDGVVQGFFECDEQPTLEEGCSFIPTAEYVTAFPKGETETSELHINEETGVLFWVETASIEDLKLKKNIEINTLRLAANRSTFPYQGKQIACDELSRSDIDAINGIIAITQSLPPNWIGGWKAVDNTYVEISTVQQWVSFYAAMVTQGSSNFAHAQMLKASLATATTASEIANIKWAN